MNFIEEVLVVCPNSYCTMLY